MEGVSEVLSTLADWAGSLNPAVASLLISAASNSIPYMTVPYLVLIAGYGASSGLSPLDKVLVALGGGLGAAIGKMIVFYIGRGVNRILSENTRENLDVFIEAFKRGVFIAVFLFAALPIPDDVLYIPLGVAGYSPLLFFVAVMLGKIVLTGVAVFFGNVLSSLVSEEAVNPLKLGAALVAGSVLVAVIISRMKWKRIISVYDDYGIVPAFVEMIVQAFMALMPSSLRSRVEEKVDNLLPKLSLRRHLQK
ncbi:MAG: hypothetical protein DSY37_03600 [Hyperthermus sp.]|nr:MAG: hypothetical protein DSY37_03600 [Hyperthermus sp.]